MKYLREYNTHDSYESELNVGGVDISLPNVSYCEDVKDVHYAPYNLVRFYVGEITGTTPQTVYIDIVPLGSVNNSTEEVQVSESNKWYTYALPKCKRLYKIEGNSVKKVVVKANINKIFTTIIPQTTVEASFKGSNTSNTTIMASMFSSCPYLTSLDISGLNTSNVTNMTSMFYNSPSLTSLDLSSFDTRNVTSMNSMFMGCTGLTLLDLSKWDTSKVTNMDLMFDGCTELKTIKMIGCEQLTIDKIKAQLTKDNITGVTIDDGKTGVTITQ